MAGSGGSGRATVHPLFGKDWRDHCQTSKSGPLPNLHNVLLALRNDQRFVKRIGYDAMLCEVVIGGRPADDCDIYLVHEWMQANGLKRVGLEAVREAIEIVGREHVFHPVRDWLEGLVWDGVPRLTDWIIQYLGVSTMAGDLRTTQENIEYYQQVGSHFLKAMVARVFEPGCKSDYMLVLEGPQRKQKSKVCAALAGPYFSDSMPDLGSDHVRVSMHLRGKWLIEVSELSSFTKADASKLKAFLSSAVEQFTPKHARKEVREPRQCCFIGTTNDDAYLKDSTGGSRFWPVKTGAIDLDGLVAAREQLFAEAVDAYRTSGRWWPDPGFEEKVIRRFQDDRYESDAWDESIIAHLNGVAGSTTLLAVAQAALGFEKAQFRKAEQIRVAAIMRQAGWRDRRSTGGNRIWERQ